MTVLSKKNVINLILLCSVLGLLTSLYLIKNHYNPSGSGSLCDLSSTVSCSIVNTSSFSELFGVPVSLLGALWFLWLILRCRQVQLHEGANVVDLFLWNVLGLAFIIYFIIAEIILGAICLLCTVVHVLIFCTFLLSLYLYQREEKIPLARAAREMRSWIIAGIILFSLPFILFNTLTSEENYDALAQCLTEQNATVYCSSRSALCAKTRAQFGTSFQLIQEVECHPGSDRTRVELCTQKKITLTPTWLIEKDGAETKRVEGFLSIEELRQFGECTKS